MFLPPINEFEHFEGNYMKKSLQNLGETIQSLLGFKKDLTFTWAESVRLIIEDLSSAADSPDSPSSLVYLKDAKLSDKEKSDLEAAILKLEDELAALKAYLGQLDAKRRETLNKLLDLKGSIRVFCRVRPFLLSDKQAYPGHLVVSDSDKLVIKLAGGKAREYNFDKVFLPGASQDEIFAEVEPIIRSALDGHNVCIFAYGQTGTGKTFTMEGKPDCPGVVPHAIQELFRLASLDRTVTFTFTFSMLEVYIGNVRDLLASRTKKTAGHMPKCLSIQMDAKGAVEIENLREVIITNPCQASKLYGKGSRARSTAWTNSNEASSRSHCLIRISISCSGSTDGYRDTSKLWMVDLGGSERLLKTQSTGQTMEEGKAINMSLSALSDVISALQKKQAHVPYRNSKLTQILRDSVGENSRVLMLVHISPKEDDLPETICSLGFATRVRGIQLGWELSPEVKVQKAATMAQLMQQMRCLEDDCQSTRNNIQAVEFLLREKKKHLEKNDPCSGGHETPESPARQITETHSIELGNVAQGSVGLPRYMNSTACSRIRVKSLDADIKYPGSIKTREHLNSRRNSLLGSAKTVIFPELDQSLYDSESTLSNNSVLRPSSLSIKKDLNRMYSKQYNIEESQCFSECSTPKDSGMIDNKYFDGSQFLSDCNMLKNIGKTDNMKANGMFSKLCSFDESKFMSECNSPKDSMKVNESECFSEYMPASGLMHSSMPHCKRVITFQTSSNKTVNKEILSNNIIEKSEPTMIKKITCNQPMNDKTTLWKEPSNDKEEYNPCQNSKQFPMQATLKPHISRGDMTCEIKNPVIMMVAALTTTKTAETATVSKPTTGLWFPIMKIAYALCLGVGLLNLGLEDDFFNGLLV